MIKFHFLGMYQPKRFVNDDDDRTTDTQIAMSFFGAGVNATLRMKLDFPQAEVVQISEIELGGLGTWLVAYAREGRGPQAEADEAWNALVEKCGDHYWKTIHRGFRED